MFPCSAAVKKQQHSGLVLKMIDGALEINEKSNRGNGCYIFLRAFSPSA